jgi:hypothetical protein
MSAHAPSWIDPNSRVYLDAAPNAMPAADGHGVAHPGVHLMKDENS